MKKLWTMLPIIMCMMLLLTVITFTGTTGMTVVDQDVNLGGTGFTWVNGSWGIDTPMYYANQTMYVQGQIWVNDTLELHNVSMLYNCSSPIEWGIVVNDGGHLILDNCELKSVTAFGYYLIGETGSTIDLNNTITHHAGLEFSGIQADGNITVKGGMIRDSGRGLSTTGAQNVILNGTEFTNITYQSLWTEDSTVLVNDSVLYSDIVIFNCTASIEDSAFVGSTIDMMDSDVLLRGTVFSWCNLDIYNISLAMNTNWDMGSNTSIDKCSDVLIEDYRNTEAVHQTTVTNCTNVTIKDSFSIGSEERGLYIKNCDDVTLDNFDISWSTDTGVAVYNTDNLTIMNSYLEKNDLGIYLNNCDDVLVYNNSLWTNGNYGIYGDTLTRANITENIVNDSALYDMYMLEIIDSEISHNDFPFSPSTSMIVIQSYYIDIFGNDIDYVGDGVGSGIFLFQDWYCNVYQNDLFDSAYGIELGDTFYSVVEDNTVSHSYFGIYLHTADFNDIRWNSVDNNSYGIVVKNCDDNEFTNNTLVENYAGLHHESSDSAIMHNNFIDNEHQAWDNSQGYWDGDIEMGGNYWSDYTGMDLDRDGYGDDPYYINFTSNAVDRYPLTTPTNTLVAPNFTVPSGVDYDGLINLTWTKITFAQGYIIQEGADENMTSPVTIYDGGNEYFTFGPRSSGTYYFRVMAYNAQDQGPFSEMLAITVQWPPEFTYFINITSTHDGFGLNLSFEVEYHEDLEFTLYNNDTMLWQPLGNFTTHKPFLLHTGLTMGKAYFYKVRAYAPATNKAAFTIVVNGTPRDQEAPPAPTGLTLTTTGKISVIVEWNVVDATDLVGVNIYRSLNFLTGYQKINDQPVTGTSYEDHNVENKKIYFYKLNAQDNMSNESPFSDIEAVDIDYNFAPFIKQAPVNITIQEDTVDRDSINVQDWFEDPDGDYLKYDVLFSEHLEVTILPSGNVTIRPEPEWSGDTNITIKVTDLLLFVEDTVRISVEPVEDKPKNLLIINPQNLQKFPSGETITFEANASDADTPYGDSLIFEWFSDIDGMLGSGMLLQSSTLSDGDHVITVVVTDETGNNATALVRIYVGEDDKPVPDDDDDDDDYGWLIPLLFAMGFIFLIVIFVVLYLLIIKRPMEEEEYDEDEEDEDDVDIEEFGDDGAKIRDFIDEEGEDDDLDWDTEDDIDEFDDDEEEVEDEYEEYSEEEDDVAPSEDEDLDDDDSDVEDFSLSDVERKAIEEEQEGEVEYHEATEDVVAEEDEDFGESDMDMNSFDEQDLIKEDTEIEEFD